MKHNIVFLTIDSLRSDKIFGKNKSSLTPHIDKLISRGICFPNTIVSSDTTDSSLGCLFTGTFPYENNITFFQNHQKAKYFFQVLKNNGYNLYSTLPKKSFFNTISDSFNHNVPYDIDPYILMYQGTGENILQMLESKTLVEPWIYYIHLMDLHPSGNKFAFPENFRSMDYGLNDYEKTLSGLDVWLGKILERLDLSSTIFILTADHGDFIPESGKKIDDIDTFQKKLKPLKKILPLGEKFWETSLQTTKSTVKKIRTSQQKQNMDELSLRTYFNRAEGHLFDEIVKVPLILRIPEKNHSKFSQQISSLDILPTIFELLEINHGNFVGQSLLPLINNLEWNEKPVYMESSSKNSKKKGLTLGIRNSKFKYIRLRSEKNTNPILYDLINDPNESKNIALDNPEIIEQMEKLLQNSIDNLKIDDSVLLSDEQSKEIEDELKKLGYI